MQVPTYFICIVFLCLSLQKRREKSEFILFCLSTTVQQPSSPGAFSQSSSCCSLLPYSLLHRRFCYLSLSSCFMSVKHTICTIQSHSATITYMKGNKLRNGWTCYVRFWYKPGRYAIALHLRIWQFSWKHIWSKNFDYSD